MAKQGDDRSIEKVSVETEEYCRNQQAHNEKEEERERVQEPQSRRHQQAPQVVKPALPLGTPPRRMREESSDGSAYDTPATFRQRCRRRLQDQKRQMNQNSVANAAAKAQATGAVNLTTTAKPLTPAVKPPTGIAGRGSPVLAEHEKQDEPTRESGSRRSVTVDFFDAQATGRFAGNAHWVSIVQDRLHKLVVGPSKGKVHVTGVQYDKRFPQERRVTLSYEGSKAVAIGVMIFF